MAYKPDCFTCRNYVKPNQGSSGGGADWYPKCNALDGTLQTMVRNEVSFMFGTTSEDWLALQEVDVLPGKKPHVDAETGVLEWKDENDIDEPECWADEFWLDSWFEMDVRIGKRTVKHFTQADGITAEYVAIQAYLDELDTLSGNKAPRTKDIGRPWEMMDGKNCKTQPEDYADPVEVITKPKAQLIREYEVRLYKLEEVGKEMCRHLLKQSPHPNPDGKKPEGWKSCPHYVKAGRNTEITIDGMGFCCVPNPRNWEKDEYDPGSSYEEFDYYGGDE